jgi:hypothetical protein
MRRYSRGGQAVFLMECDTCLRKLKYRGRGDNQREAEDNAVDNALSVGWQIVGDRLFCPKCVEMGRHEEE